MQKFLKVKDNSFLVRDSATGAILNNDRNGLLEYRRKRALAEKKNREIQEMKNDISDIKAVLAKILEKLES